MNICAVSGFVPIMLFYCPLQKSSPGFICSENDGTSKSTETILTHLYPDCLLDHIQLITIESRYQELDQQQRAEAYNPREWCLVTLLLNSSSQKFVLYLFSELLVRSQVWYDSSSSAKCSHVYGLEHRNELRFEIVTVAGTYSVYSNFTYLLFTLRTFSTQLRF